MRRRLCPKEALFTPSFIAVCSANLLFFIASFMMVPVLPIYLLDGLHASKSVVGIILSAYMIGALVMRPLSGFLADQFPRKILFLVCGILFAAQFEGYLLFNALALVGIVRALHELRRAFHLRRHPRRRRHPHRQARHGHRPVRDDGIARYGPRPHDRYARP